MLHGVLSDARINESPDRPGYYELSGYPEDPWLASDALVERDQFLRTIIWDLIKIQDIAYPRIRLMILVASIFGLILFIFPLWRNFEYILNRFLHDLLLRS